MTQITPVEWDDFLQQYPDAHILQTREWGDLKSSFGWNAVYFRKNETGAQVLFKSLPLGYKIAYIPKGPLCPNWKDLWPEIDVHCKKKNTIFLKVEPDLLECEPSSVASSMNGFKSNTDAIQPRRTLVIDINQSQDNILANMKQKTRYNIRLAAKKGVHVKQTNDIETFHRLMMETSKRDSFGVHSRSYYQKIYDDLNSRGNCTILFAFHNDQPLAGIMVFSQGKRAWYFYGASGNIGRNLMPTYLLQWEGMKWAIEQGCLEYDLWGIPDENGDTLENNFNKRSDGLWGVYRFKRGFGGSLQRSIGAWDKVYKPVLYNLYQLLNKLRHQYYG